MLRVTTAFRLFGILNSSHWDQSATVGTLIGQYEWNGVYQKIGNHKNKDRTGWSCKYANDKIVAFSCVYIVIKFLFVLRNWQIKFSTNKLKWPKNEEEPATHKHIASSCVGPNYAHNKTIKF